MNTQPRRLPRLLVALTVSGEVLPDFDTGWENPLDSI